MGPAATDKCAGEQMRSMYGEECRKRFRKSKLDVPKYCACMNDVVSAYSEETAAAILRLYHDRGALAKKAAR